jgi:nucleotide-binding universal stress UspA family protein
MTALQIEQRRAEPAFRNVTIVARVPSARRLLGTIAYELAPDHVASCDIEDVGSSERARAHEIARRAEECATDVVVMTVDDARLAARRLVARGIAVLAIPPDWRPVAGFRRIAIGYDGSEPADAALEATRALVVARAGSLSRVEVVYVDDPAPAATEIDANGVNLRRAAVIEWWLAQVARSIPAPVGVVRRTGNTVTALADLSSEVDLLVIGTHGHGGLRRIVGGRGFRRLIEATQCPVLVVPADRTPTGGMVRRWRPRILTRSARATRSMSPDARWRSSALTCSPSASTWRGCRSR